MCDSWRTSTVGELGHWSGGLTPSKSQGAYWSEDGVPWISPKDIRSDVIEDSADHVSALALAQSKLTLYGPGDVIVVFRSGILRHRFPVATSVKPFTVNQDLKVLRTAPDVDERYAYHLLRSLESRVLRQAVKSGTTVESIDTRTFRGLSFDLPPLPEQRRIARVLDTVDAAIRQTEAVIAKLKQVKAGLLHDLLTRGLDENGELRDPVRHPEQFKDSPLGRVPREWEVREVRDVCRLGRGRVISQGYLQEHPGPYPVFSSQSHGEGVFGHIDTYDFEGEYVTWTTDGANAGTVFYRSGRFSCTNVCGTLQSIEGLAMKYLACALSRRTKSYVSYIGNPKLMNNIMARIPVEVPPQPEQEAIIRRIEAVDRRTAKEESSLTKLSQLKKGLMQDLLTGRVRVPEEAVEGVTA